MSHDLAGSCHRTTYNIAYFLTKKTVTLLKNKWSLTLDSLKLNYHKYVIQSPLYIKRFKI